jgi:hypothetical protein
MANETQTTVAGSKTTVGHGATFRRVLALVIVVSFVLLIFVWVFKPPTMGCAESMAQLNQLDSTLIKIFSCSSVGFFFGSSKLAQNKDEAQTKAAEKLADKLPEWQWQPAAVVAAAEAAAPAAAAVAAPAAAAVAAPPAVDAELDRRGITDPTTEPKT